MLAAVALQHVTSLATPLDFYVDADEAGNVQQPVTKFAFLNAEANERQGFPRAVGSIEAGGVENGKPHVSQLVRRLLRVY